MTLRRPIRSPSGPTRSSPTEEGTRRWPRPSRRRCSRAHPSATTCSAAATVGSAPGDSADSSCGPFGCRRRLWASRSPVPGTLLDQITLPARGGRGSDQRDRRESSMATTTPTPSLARSQRRRAVLASTVGTTIEWYDFFLYGTAAALVFPSVFFPDSSTYAGVLAAFSTQFVGFAARPIGAAIFGHFGDRVGRKATLVTTLMLMGVATFLIGVLPSHASIGLAAPVILTVL